MVRVSMVLAAALLGATSAPAFQRPKREADPKAQACPELGQGYVRIPGSYTCVRIGGLVRVEGATIKGGR